MAEFSTNAFVELFSITSATFYLIENVILFFKSWNFFFCAVFIMLKTTIVFGIAKSPWLRLLLG